MNQAVGLETNKGYRLPGALAEMQSAECRMQNKGLTKG